MSTTMGGTMMKTSMASKLSSAVSRNETNQKKSNTAQAAMTKKFKNL
jgi:hypothetical protein